MTVCPYCAEAFDADSPRCPHCRELLEDLPQTDGSSTGRAVLIALVVLAGLLGGCLLLGFVLWNIDKNRASAIAREETQAELAVIKAIVVEHQESTGTLPSAAEDLADVSCPSRDGWGNSFLYTYSAEGFSVTSHGADGSPGGVGEDADLTVRVEPRQ